MIYQAVQKVRGSGKLIGGREMLIAGRTPDEVAEKVPWDLFELRLVGTGMNPERFDPVRRPDAWLYGRTGSKVVRIL